MTKLYLIRRNLETFIGPLSAPELKDSFQKMEFGLQDEISGSCGSWITLDNTEKLRKHYPEIARIVLDDQGNWAVSNHDTSHSNLGASSKQKSRKKPHTLSGLGWAISLLVIAAIALSSAIYFAITGKLLILTKEQDNPYLFDELKTLQDRQDEIGLAKFMDKNLREIVERTTRPKKAELQWMPYLRSHAFKYDGSIEGLPHRLLRGEGMTHTPMDCSLKTWNTRWRGAIKSINELVQQYRLVNNHWARILAWDPHWIRRRDHKGWLKGESYYLGCTLMAEQALKELFSDVTLVSQSGDWEKLGLTKVKTRLAWLVETQKSGAFNTQPTLPQSGDLLSLWTCYESSAEVKHLAQCRDSFTAPMDETTQSYSDDRFGWNLLRIVMASKTPPPTEVLQAMTQLLPKIQKGDQFSRLDYRIEIKIWRAIVKQPTMIDKILEKSQQESSEFRLIP